MRLELTHVDIWLGKATENLSLESLKSFHKGLYKILL
jgi:hypothetical protein